MSVAETAAYVVSIGESLLLVVVFSTFFEERDIVHAFCPNNRLIDLCIFPGRDQRNFSNRTTRLLNFINFVISGFMLLSGWAWHVICAPDIFSWNFSFLVLNIGQLVYIVYQMRPVRFDPELEEAYHTLFYPFKVSTLKRS